MSVYVTDKIFVHSNSKGFQDWQIDPFGFRSTGCDRQVHLFPTTFIPLGVQSLHRKSK